MLNAERVRDLLDYDQETGALTWRKACGCQKIGAVAGQIRRDGYTRVVIAGAGYQAHRLAWLWMTEAWPSAQIDHIDGVRSNNRWQNLREATQAENNQNMRVATVRNRSSRLLGVTKHKKTGKWQASIKLHGRSHYLGLFAQPDEAHAAYVEAKRRLHPKGTL